MVFLLVQRGCGTAPTPPPIPQTSPPPPTIAAPPTPLPSQPSEINDPSYFSKPEALDKPVTTLFDAKAVIGLSAADLPRLLGPRTQRSGNTLTFKPKGCDEVTVQLSEGRAVAVTIYFSVGSTGPAEALQRVGIFPSTPAERSSPQAAVWSGASLGVETAVVGAFSNAGRAGGWDCVGLK